MSIRSRGFVAAMEDDTPEVEINIGTEVPAEVEAQAAEVAEDASEIHDETQAMEDAVADAETLDMIADTAEQSVEEGEGMDPVAAEIAEVAVESIYARLGVSRRAMPSLESFGSSGSRKSATRIAVEDWKETVKKVWEAVKKFFINIWEKIKAFFANVFNAFRSLDKAAKSMKARVEEIKGEPKEKTFKDKSLAKGLGRGKAGQLTGAKAIETIKLTAEGIENMEGFFGTADSALIVIKEITSKSLDLLSDDNDERVKAAVKKVFEQLKTGAFKSEPMYDGVRIVAKTSKNEDSLNIEFTTEVKDNSGEEVAVLSKAEMSKICDEVVELAKAVEKGQKALSKFEEMNKIVSSIVENVTKLASDNTENHDKKAAINNMRVSTVSIGSGANKVATIYLSLSNKAGRSGLKYVAQSMKRYGEKKDNKKN
jgi:hypothetical protein